MALPNVAGHETRLQPPPPPPDEHPHADESLPGPPVTPPRTPPRSGAAAPGGGHGGEWALARAPPAAGAEGAEDAAQRKLKKKHADATKDLRVEEFDLSSDDGDDAGVPEAAPPSPFLGIWFEGKSPQEIYDEEGRAADTAFRQAALIQLRKWDGDTNGRFTAKQAVHLVRAMCALHEAPAPAPQRQFCYNFCTCGCLVWLVIFVLLLWLPMLIAAAYARELSAERTGVLVTADDGRPAAMASMFAHHSFHELQTMPEGSLRRIHDCTFVHKGASHHLRVASLVRTADGDVHIVAPDHSALQLEGSLAGGGGRVHFARPFHGRQEVDLREDADPSLPGGCRFTFMASAPENKARPPR